MIFKLLQRGGESWQPAGSWPEVGIYARTLLFYYISRTLDPSGRPPLVSDIARRKSERGPAA